jgi:GSH-dependent disulfide-bond oxidoreductase
MRRRLFCRRPEGKGLASAAKAADKRRHDLTDTTSNGSSPMIDAYLAGGTNAQRVTITLEETGLPYQIKKLDFKAGDMKKPEYLKLNPTGRMPTIVDNDAKGGPFVLTQSVAIMQYCAEKSGKLMGSDLQSRARVMEWLMFQATDLSPGMGFAFLLAERSEPKIPQARPLIKDRIVHLYQFMDDRLAHSKWLGGAEFSLADILAFPMAETFEHEKFAGFTHITRWRRDVASRPGVERGMKAVG